MTVNYETDIRNANRFYDSVNECGFIFKDEIGKSTAVIKRMIRLLAHDIRYTTIHGQAKNHALSIHVIFGDMALRTIIYLYNDPRVINYLAMMMPSMEQNSNMADSNYTRLRELFGVYMTREVMKQRYDYSPAYLSYLEQ